MALYFVLLKGSWTSDGCTITQIEQDGRVICSCDHLGNFALLVVSFLECLIYTHLEATVKANALNTLSIAEF